MCIDTLPTKEGEICVDVRFNLHRILLEQITVSQDYEKVDTK